MTLINAVVLAAAIALSPLAAHAAGGNFSASEAIWKLADKCNSTAISKFPDHTSEALEKRELYVRHCNRDSRTPTRQPFEVTKPKTGEQ